MKRFALLALPLFLGACITDVYSIKPEVNIDPAKVQTSRKRLTDPAVGTSATLPAGGTLTIELDANPTTGIWWSEPVFDGDVLELVSNDYVADPAPEGVVGSGGTTVMVFKSVAPGKTKVTSEYSRGGGQVYETLDVTVEVAE